MTGLAGISGREAIHKLMKLGYFVVRQKGSHARLRHFNSSIHRPLTVPLHRELKIGLISQIIKDSGVTVENFLEL